MTVLLSSMEQIRRRCVAIVRPLVLFSVCVLITDCGSRNTFVPPPPPKVVVAHPLQKPVTLYLELTGNTAPFRTANLVARVQGYLEKINYRDGAAVKKGAQLFGIERDTYQAQVDLSKAQLAKDQSVLAQAQVNLSRYQTLEQQKSMRRKQHKTRPSSSNRTRPLSELIKPTSIPRTST